jgi:hypothetical protein
MEKEVRAICERYRKGEELIFISKVNSHLLKMGEEFLIYRIEVDDNNVFRNKFYLKSKCDKKSFSVESQELINLFELKQPKDPNELIGRKVKGFRFEDSKKIKFDSFKSFYIGKKGVIYHFHYHSNSYSIKFEDGNRYLYPADQIEQHLLPEKKTKKERIEELESEVKLLISRVEFLEKRYLNIPEKQAPEFWYVDIVEEKDSELLPKFKKWYLKKINTRIDFIYSKYGFSGWRSFNGYDWISIRGWEANSDKMQKITLNQWNNWFNK